jgi:hypothetical protein
VDQLSYKFKDEKLIYLKNCKNIEWISFIHLFRKNLDSEKVGTNLQIKLRIKELENQFIKWIE